MYKDAWESITGNCDTFLFLGGQEQTTLEYVSKKLGKVTILANGYSRNRGGQGSRTESENVKGRDLMSPDEISRMDNQNCILFIRGLFPFFCKKYDYPKHKNYKYTGDAKDEYLYDYRHPERFAVEETKPKRRKPARKASARTRADVFSARDASNAPNRKTIEERKRVVQEARKPKPFTTENLAKSTGITPKATPEETAEAIAKSLTPVEGFIADYEFRGADAFTSEFLGREEDIRMEKKKDDAVASMDAGQEGESSSAGASLGDSTNREEELQEADKAEDISVPDEFDAPVDDNGEVGDEEDGEASVGIEIDDDDGDDDVSITEETMGEGDEDYVPSFDDYED